jgi:hypothetical protein
LLVGPNVAKKSRIDGEAGYFRRATYRKELVPTPHRKHGLAPEASGSGRRVLIGTHGPCCAQRG